MARDLNADSNLGPERYLPKRRLKSKTGLLFIGLLLLASVPAMAEPPAMDGSISPDEDVVLAQRYGADYSPQTEAGKEAQAAAVAAAPDAAVSSFRRDPCPAPTWTARATCANGLRDKAAMENKFPWMDLVHAYDAKILRASADADAKLIKLDELSARVKAAGDELQKSIAQRAQEEKQQPPASQRRAVLLPPAATGCYVSDKEVNCTSN